MSNGDFPKHRGPKSATLDDIFRWALEQDVETSNWWQQQWRMNKIMDQASIRRRDSMERHLSITQHDVEDIEERLNKMETSIANLRGKITVWAAVGATIGGALASAVVTALSR